MMAARSAPQAFAAYEETAAYVDGDLTRAQAITEARDVQGGLEELRRKDLRVVRVWMRAVRGSEAEEYFDGEYETGWAEVTGQLNAAQRANLIKMWKVEPK